MINKSLKLQNQLSKELVKANESLTTDLAELTLDNIFDDDLISEIPIVKSVLAIAKTGLAFRDKIFMKKLIVFINDFNSKKISSENLAKLRNNFESDKAYRSKVTEKILYVLDNISSNTKAKILSELFKSYVEEKFNWKEFIQFTFILEQLHPSLIDALHQYAKINFDPRHSDEITTDYSLSALAISSGIGIQLAGPPFKVTEIGIKFYNFGIRNTDL